MIISQKAQEVLTERDRCETGSQYATKLMAVFTPDEPEELDNFCGDYTALCETIEDMEKRLKEFKADRQMMETILRDRITYDTHSQVRGHKFEISITKSARPSVETTMEANRAAWVTYPHFIEHKFAWKKSAILKPLLDERDFYHKDAKEIAKIGFSEKLRVRDLKNIERIWDAKT